jgi:benzil reductase ((S)-benzoin forming)
MNGYIITGTSRGFGKALAQQALGHGDWVFSVGRRAAFRKDRYANFRCDLKNTRRLSAAMQAAFQTLPLDCLEALVLIHNAGVVLPIKPLQRAEQSLLEDNLKVNLLAPLLLTSAFLALSQGKGLRRRIILISSGAARHAYAGWSAYCSSKAGLHMLTQCVALEQGTGPGAVKISSFAPGVMDTRMQAQLRACHKEDFPQRDRFLELKQKGDLLQPAAVASILLDLDRNEQLTQGGFHDVRDLNRSAMDK